MVNSPECNRHIANRLEVAVSPGSGGHRCKLCGALVEIPKLVDIVIDVVGGLVLVFGILYSFSLLSFWPLGVALALCIILRILILPLFVCEKTVTK